MLARWRVNKGQTDLEGDLFACRVSCMPSDGIMTICDGCAVEKSWPKNIFFLPVNVNVRVELRRQGVEIRVYPCNLGARDSSSYKHTLRRYAGSAYCACCNKSPDVVT